MAKSKNRKKKKHVVQKAKIKPANYIRQHARKLPIHECLIQDNWKDTSFTPMVISRKRKNGNLVAATYIVDLQCLGVKESSFIYDIDPYSYSENIKMMEDGMNVNFIKIEANLAHNIIYGAVEYAEDCGIAPHKDFTNITEYLLDPVESIEFVDVHFGDKEGKPFYFEGPYDDSQKILATLRKHVGEGNFHYTIGISTPAYYDYDYDNTNPKMSKQEILDTYLPNDKVEEKIKNFELESYQSAYIPQIICAGFILEEVEGELDRLEKLYYDKQQYFMVNVLEKLVNSYASAQNVDIDKIDPDVIDELDNLVIFLAEKMMEFGSTDFLFEKDYTPIPPFKTDEEIKEMTAEELDAHYEQRLFYMTNLEKYYHTIREYAYYFLSVNHKDTDFLNEDNQKKAIQDFLNDAKKESKEPKNEEEIKDYEEACQAIIHKHFLNREKN